MPVLILKALECNRTSGATVDVSPRLNVTVDGEHHSDIKLADFFYRQRRILNNSIKFKDKVRVKLQFFVFAMFKTQIGDTLNLNTETLPHQLNGQPGFHRGKIELKGLDKKSGAHYYLWYEVIPDGDGMTPANFHSSPLASTIKFRDTLGRMSKGVMTDLEHKEFQAPRERHYSCSEVISLRDTFSLHRPQDGEKDNTVFFRRWVARHCNIWGEESVIPIEQLPVGPRPGLLASVPNWHPVKDESSHVLAGFCIASRGQDEDNPFTHMSKDWVFNIIPSPAFSYMLAYTAKTRGVTDPENEDAEKSILPLSHNEWETGSMPEEWRPLPGEFVTIFGRHVFDLGHLTMTTEMHPPHTIVREATHGNFNQAIIGMGFSGGFPGSVKAESGGGELDARWNAEFGGFWEGLHFRNQRCWPTNLKKHPLKIKLFPPVPRPSSTAILKAVPIDWRIIIIKKSRMDKFLKSCGAGGGEGKKEHTFDEWFPEGLQIKPPEFKPITTDRGDFFDLEINLSGAQDIPVAYFASVDCFWREV